MDGKGVRSIGSLRALRLMLKGVDLPAGSCTDRRVTGFNAARNSITDIIELQRQIDR